MNPLRKAELYVATARRLKPQQVAWRLWRMAGLETLLKRGLVVCADASKADIAAIPTLPELDFDPAFLGRYDCDAILRNELELLHHRERVDWQTCWAAGYSTPLWQFNLHYHEYALALGRKSLDTSDPAYFLKAVEIIEAWIAANPRNAGGAGWHPYVISMRIVNWLAFLGEFRELCEAVPGLVETMTASLAEQYEHLSRHVEKDLLANHYLENLKALVLLAAFFGDDEYLKPTLAELQKQISVQILSDGMHYERSPMYHKIVLEDLLRVMAALAANGIAVDPAGMCRLQDMCNCLYSLERNANRTPLFNDAGDNVAKSRDALLACAKRVFGIRPAYANVLPEAGYAMLEKRTPAGMVKVVFDAGPFGPGHALGHAHCDALSFEAFVNGEPWVVSLGTYAYQDESRLARKATRAHSAPMLLGREQADCWAPFRVVARGKAELLESDDAAARGRFTYFDSRAIERRVTLADDGIRIQDEAVGGGAIRGTLHFSDAFVPAQGSVPECGYSPEFGMSLPGYKTDISGEMHVITELPYPQTAKEHAA